MSWKGINKLQMVPFSIELRDNALQVGQCASVVFGEEQTVFHFHLCDRTVFFNAVHLSSNVLFGDHVRSNDVEKCPVVEMTAVFAAGHSEEPMSTAPPTAAPQAAVPQALAFVHHSIQIRQAKAATQTLTGSFAKT